jgi:acyl carrier protein
LHPRPAARKAVNGTGTEAAVDDILRDIISRHCNIAMPAAQIRDEDDLFDLGLSSFACVQLMIAVEECFGIEFPDALMHRSTFQSMAALGHHIQQLQSEDMDA